MSKGVSIVLTAGLILAGAFGWLLLRPGPAPEVNFTRARREKLVSRLVTNGRIDPVDDLAIQAPRDGLVRRILVKQGQTLATGAIVAELEPPPGFQAELASAEARRVEAQGELRTLETGGTRSALAEIDAARARAEQELTGTQNRAASVERLVDKNAAPRVELEQLKARISELELELRNLAARRTAIVPASGRESAAARVMEAETEIARLRNEVSRSLIRTPGSGLVYELARKNPGPVRTGEVIARIGKTDLVRAIVFVDEPELGRVSTGMSVTITWDGMPKREWAGEVSRMPSRIVALNSRQVGEVECLVENSDGRLLPGANINAELITQVVEGALVLPTGAIRHNGPQAGVWVLTEGKVAWRSVTLGASSVSDTQIISGVSDGESVALGAYESLAEGDSVTPRYP